MNLLSSFNDFYSNLSSNGMFFFWIVVFLVLFLAFLVVILLLKNKKLTRLIKEESLSVKDVNKEGNLKVEEENASEIIEEAITIPKEEPIIEKKEEVKAEEKQDFTGPYSKNVLREMNARMQTSPIHIDKNNVNNSYQREEQREEFTSPLEELEDITEVNDNMKFASEIVSRMEEEIKPSNIELTDYEKKQEEEAIISYDELLKVKDKIYNITEDEETDEFIDELKSFRLDL